MRVTLSLVFAVLVVGAMNASAQALVPGGTGAPPTGARIAFVDFDRVATTSTVGKAATTQLDALRGKKAAEVADRRKQLQALQAKLPRRVADERDAWRSSTGRGAHGRELERFTQDAGSPAPPVQLQRSFGEKCSR